MNQERLTGVWLQVRGTAKQRWGTLTGNTSIAREGQRDHLAGRKEELHGISREQATRQLQEFLRRNRNWDLSKS